MSEIIRLWLQNRLGLLFEDQLWHEDRGGGVLATLLNSYTLLTDEQTKIILSKQGELYGPTLEVMRLVITGLGINLDKEEYQNVLDAKGTSVNKLFYELYMILQGRDSTDIILSRKLKDPVKLSRFSVSSHDEDNEISEDIEVTRFDNPLAATFTNNEAVIVYHIDKYLELMEKCKKNREDYLRYFENKDSASPVRKMDLLRSKNELSTNIDKDIDIAELPLDAESLNQSMSELMHEKTRAVNLGCIKPDEKISKNIITSIQNKSRKMNQNRDLRDTLRKKILKDLWDKLMEEQEDYFKHDFMDKLQQQSMYEQKITTCLMNVREKRHEILEQKREMMEYIRDQHEEAMYSEILGEESKESQERFKYYKEKTKKQELHEKMYKKKMERAKAQAEQEVDNIIKDILDIAFYNIDYKANNCEPVPRRKRDDLARLFIAQQPIFDVLQDVSDIISSEQYSSSMTNEEEEDEVEPITVLELDRQNAMDELTFEDYTNYKWPWDYNSWMEYKENTEMILGLNVIGHVVNRILSANNSRNSVLNMPAIPRTNIAVCLDGLHNLEYIPALEQLLQARKVKIIQMTDAFEYCLSVFKKESTEEYFDGVFDKATEEGLKVIDKEKKGANKKSVKKGSKQLVKSLDKEDKKQKKVKSVDDEPPALPAFEDKINQTPNLFPEDEVVLSDAGNVGKTLFEVMNLGGAPCESLNAAAFVEYLKSLNFNEIEGWALINYPQTIQQAIILEETLSGKRIPVELSQFPTDKISDLVNIENHPGLTDSTKDRKKSKLFTNSPGSLDDDLDYDTFLTAFIELRTAGKDDPDEKAYECFKSPENTVALCQFYQNQGCKYTLVYETIDFSTIKHLGKLILGDYSMPPKDSVTLFTDTVHYVEANFDEIVTIPTTNVIKEGEKKKKKSTTTKSEAKQEKSTRGSKETKKSSKPKEKKAKVDEKGKKTKKINKEAPETVVDMEDEETQIPTPLPEPEEVEEPYQSPALPGESHWKYHDLPIVAYYEDALATLWENIEAIYINDMMQLFFRRRIIMDALMPYNFYVKKNLLEFIARPDTKQSYLTDFQLIYNEFEDDMREDDEVKAELHMRIEEFREKLWKICDARMMENEAERVRIVKENWVTTQLMELCNIYISFLQLELDRSTDTCLMLVDYYTAMITGLPNLNVQIEKIKLNIIPLPENIEDMDHIAPFVEFTEKALQTQKKTDFTNVKNNPYVNKLKVTLDNGFKNLENIFKECMKIYNDLEAKFNPKNGTNKKKKTDKSTNKKNTGSDTQIIEPDEDVKNYSSEILQEFQVAFMGEYYRCKLRFEILHHAFEEEIQDMLEKGNNSFNTLYKFIEERYKGEIRAVDQATTLLKRAVEEEIAIQPEMLLENDKFFVKLGSLMYESPLPDEDDLPIREPDNDELFNISQLTRIANVLFRLAPKGIIPTKAFTFLLQEFLVYRGEDGQEDYVPKIWKKLPPYKVQRLITEIFGDTEYLDWKDFIIYCLNIRFPTEKEVLEIRQQFRSLDPDMTELIHDHQYGLIQFWFEEDIMQPRLKNLRELLFKLFCVGSRLNYTALLLVFCKDADPIIGLVKAIEVSIGKLIMHNEEQGSLRYAKSLKQIMARELDTISKQNNRAESISQAVIDKLIDDTIHCTNSVVLEALDNDDASPLCSHDIVQYLNESRISSTKYEENGFEKPTSSVSDYEYAGDTSVDTSGSQAHIAREPIEYQVSFDVLINIFTVMIPWLHKVRSFGEMTFHERFAMLYNSLINEDIRVAYIYQILIHTDFLAMFMKFYKFYDRRLVEIVRHLLEAD